MSNTLKTSLLTLIKYKKRMEYNSRIRDAHLDSRSGCAGIPATEEKGEKTSV